MTKSSTEELMDWIGRETESPFDSSQPFLSGAEPSSFEALEPRDDFKDEQPNNFLTGDTKPS